jgi:hypothetical protein
VQNLLSHAAGVVRPKLIQEMKTLLDVKKLVQVITLILSHSHTLSLPQ